MHAGEQGWELVTIVANGIAYLKRRVGEQEVPAAPRHKAAKAQTAGG
jgi:hypothetical protein